MFQNFYDEVRKLAEMVQIGGNLSDMNKQADLLLNLLDDETLINQNAIDYLSEHYDIQNGYCVCENEGGLIARLFGIQLAHGVCITTETNRSEKEIIDTCVEAAEVYFNATRLSQMSYSLKEYALNNEPYSKILREPEKRSEYAVEVINKDGELKYQWDVCNSLEAADGLINAIVVGNKSSSPMRFRITRINYEGDKEVSSETVKRVTI